MDVSLGSHAHPTANSGETGRPDGKRRSSDVGVRSAKTLVCASRPRIKMCVTTAIGTSTIIRSTAWAQPRARAGVLDMRSPRCGGTRARVVPARHPSGARTGEERLDSRLSSHTPTVVIGAWHPAAHSTTRARPRPRWSSSTNSMDSRPYKLPPAAALSPSPNRSSSFNTCTSLTYVRFLDSLSHELAKPSDHLVVSPPPPDSKAPKRQDIGHGPLLCPGSCWPRSCAQCCGLSLRTRGSYSSASSPLGFLTSPPSSSCSVASSAP